MREIFGGIIDEVFVAVLVTWIGCGTYYCGLSMLLVNNLLKSGSMTRN